MPGANLGIPNPLPDIKNQPDSHSAVTCDESVPAEDAKYVGWGGIHTILPYLIQDGYDRDKQLREYEAVILENDYIKAEFIPSFGGRLWSLYDKENKRHLLHRNPVFQPCNLAVRNAWISGGVEWNLGMTGHTPFTLEQLHTSVLKMSDGTPVLRMYEWERIRRVSYQIDAYLPENSRYLFVRVRLRNTHNEETPIYWWSNMAVDETKDTRVLSPADKAFKFDYTSVLSLQNVPLMDGVDVSYSTNYPHGMDQFYKIPPKERKWEVALDGKGEGLVQCSTDILKGRKLFLWGYGPGGKRWQEYLSVPGSAYLETQAGLGNTQMEHLPMPANACWEWLEAYGMMKADPNDVHSENWQDAYTSVGKQLEKDLPRHVLDDELKRLESELMTEAELKLNGSGWAKLELLRRGTKGNCFEGESATYAEDSIGEEQKPWLELLNTGVFPDWDIDKAPAAYLVQTEWIKLLEDSVNSGKSKHWHAYNQLGVMYYAAADKSKAKEAFEMSRKLKNNAWAIRNLAALKAGEGKVSEAADMLLEAMELLTTPHMARECASALIGAKRYDEFMSFYNKLPNDIQETGRMQVFLALAAANLGDFDRCNKILTSGIQVYDMREGEVLLSDAWIEMHKRRIIKEEGAEDNSALKERVLKEFPIPADIDFRMST